MKSKSIVIAAMVIASARAACASESHEVREEPKRAGPPSPWETMGFEARKAYMTEVVLPRMTEVFQAYDPKYFAQVSCETCHGVSAEDNHYKMPNEDLFALYPTGHEKQIELVKRQPAILKFMFNKVVPEVRALIDAPAYDVVSGTGFSCFSCHPRGQ